MIIQDNMFHAWYVWNIYQHLTLIMDYAWWLMDYVLYIYSYSQ